jgi:hypothetical protein
MSEENAAPVEGQPAAAEASWIDGLHEDFKSDPTISRFKTEDGLNKFVESHLELRKKMGNAIWIPQEGAKPEDVADFRTKLGIPQSPDKYEIKYKEHEALQYDENTDKAFKALAHQIGLTPKQAQTLVDFDADRFIGAFTSNSKTYEDAVNAVKEEWGNDYQVKLDKANNVIRHFADEKDMETIKRYENDPTLARLFSKIGDAMSEHTFVQGSGNDIQGTREALQAEAVEYSAIALDESKPMHERKAADKKAQKIYEKLFGTAEVSGSAQMTKM